MTKYNNFVELALSFLDCHYIWQGKGLSRWTPQGLVKHKFTDLNNVPLFVFDCSGLVTHCLWEMSGGKVDLRASHSAQTILETFPLADANSGDGTLILYPGHVSVDLGRERVVDAQGGDQATLSILDAEQRNAKVAVHRRNRLDSSILGYRRIPLDKSELRSV